MIKTDTVKLAIHSEQCNENGAKFTHVFCKSGYDIRASADLYVVYNKDRGQSYGFVQNIQINAVSSGPDGYENILDYITQSAKKQNWYQLVVPDKRSKMGCSQRLELDKIKIIKSPF